MLQANRLNTKAMGAACLQVCAISCLDQIAVCNAAAALGSMSLFAQTRSKPTAQQLRWHTALKAITHTSACSFLPKVAWAASQPSSCCRHTALTNTTAQCCVCKCRHSLKIKLQQPYVATAAAGPQIPKHLSATTNNGAKSACTDAVAPTMARTASYCDAPQRQFDTDNITFH